MFKVMKMYSIILFLVSTLLFSCNKTEPFIWDEKYDISIMSFNIRYDTPDDGEHQWSNRKEACVQMLEEIKPAVFGIQEGLQHQVNYLDEELVGYDYIGVGRDDGHFRGEYAAIFYLKDRFEVIKNGNFWLSETPDTPSLGWDANNIRIVSWVQLKDHDHGKEIFIFNTHFDHKGAEARKESAKLLIDRINYLTGEDAPVFVTGDFNALLGNDILDPILREMKEAQSNSENTNDGKSFNGWGKLFHQRNIDFIFYKEAEALAFRTVIKDYGVPFISDHYPIIAYFEY